MLTKNGVKANEDRIIIHFDYDCFYAAVFEAENPILRSLPLAVQQKQIIVTCNYEARRQGLRKLQLVTEAKQKCPDLIIVLGEDLTRFRNASKKLYDFLRTRIWSGRAERLGFDEVFLDVTDMVSYNVELLNFNDLATSFLHLSKAEPTLGFTYDASRISGHTFPPDQTLLPEALSSAPVEWGRADDERPLAARLMVASHLAQHLRRQLEEQTSFTSTVGISTSKLLSKLVGNCNKPKAQTTLVPSLHSDALEDNVTTFMDGHDIGKVPGIGFKLAQKLRNHHLDRPADFDQGLIYGGTKENVSVGDIRRRPEMGPELLDQLLAGPGAPRDIGVKIWGLLNGVDDSVVEMGRRVPKQISIEDSYLQLNSIGQIQAELLKLSRSLLERMRIDLTEDLRMTESGGDGHGPPSFQNKRWIAHPRTLRLTTRPRPPANPDGSRSRSFKRISRSGMMPNFVFSLSQDVEVLAKKLAEDTLWPQFRKLHPDVVGLDLSLVNVGATNIIEAAVDVDDGETRAGADRDIQGMFRRQTSVLQQWTAEMQDVLREDSRPENIDPEPLDRRSVSPGSSDEEHRWQDDVEAPLSGIACTSCGAVMPAFAMMAHKRFHEHDE